MSLIVFDPAVFRTAYPLFANVACYPDDTLTGWFDAATNYISDVDYGCLNLSGKAQVLALNLMTAHIGFIFKTIADGDTPALMQSATIDKVTVTVTPPPVKSQFNWWLSLSPYGQQLLALLQTVGVGGFYAGGLPERSAFRRVGGGFGGAWPRGRG